MNIHQWLEYIESLHPKAMDLGLDAVREVGTRAGILKPTCPVVLVAGTNGKGSTIYALEKLLRQSHKKVGCYTSPHLCQFNERIRLNGTDVSDQSLIFAFEFIEHHRKNTPLTYFEFTTLAAFYLFQQSVEPLDILLCEVGLGGRLDAVNCLEPDLSIITTIDYDHEDWLGHDLEKIAFEKAGILRFGQPCIIGSGITQQSLAKRVQELKSTAYYAEKDFQWTDKQCLRWEMQGISVDVPQNHLPENSVSVALAAYNNLRSVISLLPISEIVCCLTNCFVPGRFQIKKIEGGPQIIMDVAHNKQSCQYLKSRLLKNGVPGKSIAVWAMLSDKPTSYVVQTFKALFSMWCVPELDVGRALSAHQLAMMLEQEGAVGICQFETVAVALSHAIQSAEEQDQIVVFGSFHVVGDAITYLKKY
tara:strand:- start:7183 stop:8436 length:1254 start_codon:yes stop_codon:yes gene_type:complete